VVAEWNIRQAEAEEAHKGPGLRPQASAVDLVKGAPQMSGTNDGADFWFKSGLIHVS
jgi:hypothetical protein